MHLLRRCGRIEAHERADPQWGRISVFHLCAMMCRRDEYAASYAMRTRE
jgi:hypothetical protein